MSRNEAIRVGDSRKTRLSQPNPTDKSTNKALMEAFGVLLIGSLKRARGSEFPDLQVEF
jgi:hypothetical protein